MRKHFVYILTAIIMCAVSEVFAQGSFYDQLEEKGYEVVNIENEGLMGFIDDLSYDDPQLTGDYSYSTVKEYSKGVPSKPAGIMLNWNSSTPSDEIARVVVTVVESDVEKDESLLEGNAKNLKRYYPGTSSREYLLCNMCPLKYCYYKVEEEQYNGRRTVVKRGRFYTEGTIRMLRVDGMTNVRDFGGWRTTFKKDVVYGRIFRGSRPESITETGKNDFVKNEHITADFDLRGSNLGSSPLGPIQDVEYYCTDNARYKLALTTHTEVLAKNLNNLADVLRRGGNVFLHCNHGANRAGTLSFLIDGILGYTEADLGRDYELSSFAWGSIQRSSKYGEMLPLIRSYGRQGDDLAQCFYNYARHIGVSQENLDTIRQIMLGLSADDPLILKAHR